MNSFILFYFHFISALTRRSVKDDGDTAVKEHLSSAITRLIFDDLPIRATNRNEFNPLFHNVEKWPSIL